MVSSEQQHHVCKHRQQASSAFIARELAVCLLAGITLQDGSSWGAEMRGVKQAGLARSVAGLSPSAITLAAVASASHVCTDTISH